jgi:hypothetical protein
MKSEVRNWKLGFYSVLGTIKRSGYGSHWLAMLVSWQACKLSDFDIRILDLLNVKCSFSETLLPKEVP